MPSSLSAKILVVDDEAALKTALCNGLKDKGYEAVGFTSGKDAIAALRIDKFDVLLTDLMMPEVDGIALLREALKIDADLVAIVLTGEGTIATAVEAMKLGASDYVLKPFKLGVIVPSISRALAMRRLRLEKTELEGRLRERTADLEIANRELKTANGELEAFAYSVAHDLGAPLRAIQSLGRIVVDDYAAQLPSEAQGFMTQILTSAQRMKRMMEDLLRLSRISQSQLSKQKIELSTLVKDVLADLRGEYESRSVEVRLGQLPDCFGDAALLKQVFVNLLSNAFKFTRGKPQAVVEIGYEEQGDEKVYFVRDNGAGFEMKNAPKLFGVFQRLHGEKEFEGTGVGLSIVRRIVERHDGRIWADAMAGQGATFYFTLDTNSSN